MDGLQAELLAYVPDARVVRAAVPTKAEARELGPGATERFVEVQAAAFTG